MTKLTHTTVLIATLVLTALSAAPMAAAQPSTAAPSTQAVRYGTEAVDGVDIFFRESGHPSNPAVVLLHGFPASSHMYREVVRELGDEYYVVAPDYPGFGNSAFPPADTFTYTFDHLAEVIDTFLEQRNIKRYALMVQDYGAPVGFRIATAHPERVSGIITMNGNAYEEGLSETGWGPIFEYWKTPTAEIGNAIAAQIFTLEGMKWQYTHGTRNPEAILPDSWILDTQRITRPGQKAMQLALFYDYRDNVKLYPKWQQYLRDQRPPTLITWGKNDAFFPPAGAEAFLRDVPDAELHLLDTGHFALEEEAPLIIAKMRAFLKKLER